jgi:6-phosphofructokinase 1
MRIGILTGGGDVPGLNPCIKAVVRRAQEFGWEVVGFRRGWAGPLNFNPSDDEASREKWLMALDPIRVRGIDRTGGTILHSSRTNPSKVRKKDMPDFLVSEFPIPEGEETSDCTAHVMRVLDHLEIDALIPIGGDDTLSYGARLHREGVKVMSVPKTMDNDVYGTDYCIGFSTAVTRSVDHINALRTPTGSHERVGVIELFGRNSGETALISGYLADADRVLISEVPFDIEKVADLIARDRTDNPAHYAMLVLSEGAAMIGGQIVETGEADAYGHRKLGGIGEVVSGEITRLTGLRTVSQSLGYMMRAGAPDALDQMVAKSYGTMAVQQLAEGVHGKMMALHDGKYDMVDGDMCIKGEKRVDIEALYDVEAYRPRIARVRDKPMFMY